MVNIRDTSKNGRLINQSGHSLKNLTRKQEVQGLSGLVESDYLELETMPGLVDKAIRLQEKLPKLKKDKDRLLTENKFALPPGTEIFDLKTKIGFIVESLQKVKSHGIETKRNLKKTQQTVQIVRFRKKTLTEIISSMTEGLSNSVLNLSISMSIWIR